jgi:hypothetical protein
LNCFKETFENLGRKGMLRQEVRDLIEFFSAKLETKQQPGIFTPVRIEKAITNSSIHLLEAKENILSKMKPAKSTMEMKERVLTAVSQSIRENLSIETQKPNMHFRRGCKEPPNPLEKLPYYIALPFYAIDRSWDVATDIAAFSLSTFVILPIRVSREFATNIFHE